MEELFAGKAPSRKEAFFSHTGCYGQIAHGLVVLWAKATVFFDSPMRL
jgi:hypothetical protein